MEKREAPAKASMNARHPQRPASALHADKIHLADLDNARLARPASAPASSSTLHMGTHAEGEIRLAQPEPLPEPAHKPKVDSGPAQKAIPSSSSRESLFGTREPWEIDTSKLILQNVIGRGSFGCVYRGFYGDQEVAVKLLDWGEELKMAKSEVESVRSSYIQEATVWHNLSHPNITKFVGAFIGDTKIKTFGSGKDVYVTSSVGCVVEEYLHGGSLKQYLTRHHEEKLSFELAMRFACDLAKG